VVPLIFTMAMPLSKKRDLDSPAIPDRLYFKIGDVARICNVETYVLRFWETQFPQLKPNKSGTGQRLYRRSDVELALRIKRLVHIEGYTLSGARQALEQLRRRGPQREPQQDPQPLLPLLAPASGQPLNDLAATIAHARAELREIAGLLASPEPQPKPQPQAPRHRSRLATMPSMSGSLFPAS
jgi:DNA-binding transcriptional MerR regulator